MHMQSHNILPWTAPGTCLGWRPAHSNPPTAKMSRRRICVDREGPTSVGP